MIKPPKSIVDKVFIGVVTLTEEIDMHQPKLLNYAGGLLNYSDEI